MLFYIFIQKTTHLVAHLRPRILTHYYQNLKKQNVKYLVYQKIVLESHKKFKEKYKVKFELFSQMKIRNQLKLIKLGEKKVYGQRIHGSN